LKKNITNYNIIGVNSTLVIKFNRRSQPKLRCYPMLEGIITDGLIITKDNTKYRWKQCHVLGNFPLVNGDTVTFLIDDSNEAEEIIYSGDLISIPEPYKKNEVIFNSRGRNVLCKESLTLGNEYIYKLSWNCEWLRFEASNVKLHNSTETPNEQNGESINTNTRNGSEELPQDFVIESSSLEENNQSNEIPPLDFNNIPDENEIINSSPQESDITFFHSNHYSEKSMTLNIESLNMNLNFKTSNCSYVEFVEKVIEEMKKK